MAGAAVIVPMHRSDVMDDLLSGVPVGWLQPLQPPLCLSGIRRLHVGGDAADDPVP